jgi:hypothetical protein
MLSDVHGASCCVRARPNSAPRASREWTWRQFDDWFEIASRRRRRTDV